MCGILGTNFISNKFDKSLELLNNRGPDFQKFINIDNKQFGHTRLAIIDLDEEANQPMIFDDILLVFNGEIYNYNELILSEELECKTKSDSEVLIRLYQKYGFDFLNKLNGMFAFCIFDMKKNLYFSARDRYGKKPFFYYFKHNKFIFSSSIKSILNLLDYKPNLNKVALSKYMQYFVSFGEDTFYQDIYKLEAASYMIYEPNKALELQKKKYYKINTYKAIKDEKQALNDIEELLFKSVEYRLNSDVEVASLLSGGIDSSLISALYTKISGKKINTFSVGYDEYKNYCELDFAQITATHINSNHNPVVINQKEYINYFEQTHDMLEEPHGDSAAIPLNILTKQIHKSGIKTVLSGEGSDEIFLGIDKIKELMPQERRLAFDYSNIKIEEQILPITPASHYSMGGIKTNKDAKTNIKNLFACGECAETSIHGANRLGGNSLLEIVTFGKIAGINASNEAKKINEINKSGNTISKEINIINEIYSYPNEINFYDKKDEIGKLLFNNLGLFRNEIKILDLIEKIKKIQSEIKIMGISDKSKYYNKNLVEFIEFKNIINVALLVCISALNRKESRGSHFRLDFPFELKDYEKNSIIKKSNDEIVFKFEEIKWKYW